MIVDTWMRFMSIPEDYGGTVAGAALLDLILPATNVMTIAATIQPKDLGLKSRVQHDGLHRWPGYLFIPGIP